MRNLRVYETIYKIPKNENLIYEFLNSNATHMEK